MGILLNERIGDTIRVSLTGPSVREVEVAYEILRYLGLRKRGPEFVSCPTCGRTEINIIDMANRIEKQLKNIKAPVKIAIMGCIVNGPGEAEDADFALCGGKKQALIYISGKKYKKIDKNIVNEFVRIVKWNIKSNIKD